MAKFEPQGNAMNRADEKAAQTGERHWVFYNHKTNKFSVRKIWRCSVDEEPVYVTA